MDSADSLLVGVDAGGTSTKALALDLKTGEQRTARAEGANWTVHGPALCAERLGDRVGKWAPINEPNVVTLLGHAIGEHAPGKIYDRERERAEVPQERESTQVVSVHCQCGFVAGATQDGVGNETVPPAVMIRRPYAGTYR